MRHGLLRRIREKLVKKDNGCLEWTGEMSKGKYPRINIKYEKYHVIRLLYNVFIEQIENKYDVIQLCCNEKCCKPEHLYVEKDIIKKIKYNIEIVDHPKIELKECWEWQGCCNKLGYGTICYNSKRYLVHRLIWHKINGPIPEEMKVLHECDNPPCCNIDHLKLGTCQDNTDDMFKRGRANKAIGDNSGSRKHPESYPRGDDHYFRKHPEKLKRGNEHWTRKQPDKVAKGENQGNSKLKEIDVIEIRKLYSEGWKPRHIAKKFNIPKSTINKIIYRITWKHIP